jgi:N-acyl-D-amino-acid deacylase
MSSILIKNGLVYDGIESPPVKTDVLVRGEKIVGLGTFPKSQADKTIDAAGAIVTPGIVDVNTDSDHFLSIFLEPHQTDFIKQGVTAIIGGNCGMSLAPLLDGSLDSIREWSDTSKVNVDWRSIRGFLDILKKRKIGVNFGTLVGHSTVRQALTRGEPRDLTETELNSFKEVLAQALKEGAFGLSIGLSYLPLCRIPFREIRELVKITASAKGVYATHLRDAGEGLEDSIAEVIDVTRETGVNLEISHFQPLKNFIKSYRQSLETIEKESAQVLIHFDCYPFETTARPIFTLLPPWVQNSSLEIMFDRLISPHLEGRILEYLWKLRSSDLTIGYVPSPFQRLCGKTLEEFAGDMNVPPPQALLRLMRFVRLRAIVFNRDIDEKVLEDFMNSPRAIISSNGAGLAEGEFKHERNWNTFPKFLKWASSGGLSLEKAVAKITSIPARKYGINKRGVIGEGCYADLAVWRSYRPSEVLLNGVVVLEEGRPINVLAGKVLKKNL